MKIKKGDIVKIISGSYSGKQGRVLKVINERERLIVEGINMLKKHMRPNQENQQGAIIEKEGDPEVLSIGLRREKAIDFVLKHATIVEA